MNLSSILVGFEGANQGKSSVNKWGTAFTDNFEVIVQFYDSRVLVDSLTYDCALNLDF